MVKQTGNSIRETAEKLWRKLVDELTPKAEGVRLDDYSYEVEGKLYLETPVGRRKSFTFFRDSVTVAEEVCAGIPVHAFDHALDRGVLQRDEIRIVLPERTYRSRKKKNEPLSLDESDRFARVLQIIELATETFGSTDKAHRWLRQPKRRFGGKTPISMLSTSHGAQAVEDMLMQIGHGIAA